MGEHNPQGCIRDGVEQVAAAARAGGAGAHASGQGGPGVDAARHGAAGVEVLVDGHGQRLAVQELLLRRRQLGPTCADRMLPIRLLRDTAAAVRYSLHGMHANALPIGRRNHASSWSGRRKGGVGILIGWLSGANKSAKVSNSRPEITTKSRWEGSHELSPDSSKDGAACGRCRRGSGGGATGRAHAGGGGTARRDGRGQSGMPAVGARCGGLAARGERTYTTRGKK